jgi:hypothetical protein
MAYFDSGLGTEMDNPVARALDRRYAIVQKEYLALAFKFAINCGANDPFIVG